MTFDPRGPRLGTEDPPEPLNDNLEQSKGLLPISQSELSVSSSAKVKLRSGHRLVTCCTAWRDLSDKLRTHHRKCELNFANAEATKVELSNAMDLSCHTGSGKDHRSSSSTHPEVLPEEVEPSKEPSTEDGKEKRRKAVTTRRHDDGAEAHYGSNHVIKRYLCTNISCLTDGALPHPSPTSSRPPQVLLHRKKAQRHDDDGSDGDDESDGDEDGALPHPSPTSSRVQRRKQAPRHDDDDGSDGDDESDSDEDGALPHPSPASSRVQRRKQARRHDDDEDGNEQPTNTTRQKRVKKVAAKRKYHVDADAADDDDGERQNVSSRRPTVKRLKKTANKTQHNDDDVPKVRTRRRWSFEERTAVQRRMAQFIAHRKVPVKNDCLLCIEKESPVLNTRTWKDVKYCVYNEILKVEKMLGVYDSCFSSV
ncbi:hypothetical protein ABVT39_002265 [Epinephelus coioides]